MTQNILKPSLIHQILNHVKSGLNEPRSAG